MFQGLTYEICERAWGIASASLDVAQSDGVTNKYAGTIVVCVRRSGDEVMNPVFMSNIDNEHPSSAKYENIAAEKAQVSWVTGMPSRKVQQDAPHLYQTGMTKWGGSVIENGLVVAFSGVQAVFDEAIAGTMLRWIVALCQDEMTREGGVMDMDTSFIGEFEQERARGDGVEG